MRTNETCQDARSTSQENSRNRSNQYFIIESDWQRLTSFGSVFDFSHCCVLLFVESVVPSGDENNILCKRESVLLSSLVQKIVPRRIRLVLVGY